VAEQLLARMEPEEAADVQALLEYDEDSAGRIMTTDFVRVLEDTTVGEALALIRSLEEVPDPLLAVYVVALDDPGTLRGLVRLRTLILSDPATPVTEVMDEDLPSVAPEDRAASAAHILAEYNLLAVPVLDEERHLLGIVTVDDALAVLLPEIWQRRGGRTFA
jgi:magnesium transporter